MGYKRARKWLYLKFGLREIGGERERGKGDKEETGFYGLKTFGKREEAGSSELRWRFFCRWEIKA